MSESMQPRGISPGELKAFARINEERSERLIPPEKRVAIPFEAVVASKRERDARRERETAAREIGRTQGERNGAAAARVLAKVAGAPLMPVAQLSGQQQAILLAKLQRPDVKEKADDLTPRGEAIFGGAIGRRMTQVVVNDLIAMRLLCRPKKGEIVVTEEGVAVGKGLTAPGT